MGLVFDIETGRIDLSAVGSNGFIIRKDGKKIPIPSTEPPKLADGDTIVCGKETSIHIYNSYNTGKDKPVDDYKFRASKSVDMGPESELQVSSIERWDKTDAKTKERHHGELITEIELKKGFFQVSYSHTDDVLMTPIALIKFIFDGGGFFDVYNDIVYSAPRASTSIGAGGTEYTNKLTKKSFTAKSNTFEEIIVTRDGIYRRGLTQMDDIFANAVQLTLYFTSKIHENIPTIDPKTMAEQYKNMPKTMEQALGGLETMKNMPPTDLERLMKMGMEKSGQKITPEMMEKMKEIPEMLKMMEQKGTMKQMKQAMAMGKGMMEGLGNDGIDRLTKAQTKGFEQLKKGTKEMLKTTEGKGIEELIESPRKYKPLTKESGAVKVA